MTEVTPTPAGLSMDIDISAPTPPSTPAAGDAGNKAFIDTLPESYRQKEWAVNLAKHQDPMSELFKLVDNQSSLVGRKAEGLRVPGENATADDWSAFHKAIGVPETPDVYEYKAPENVPEDLKDMFKTDEDLVKVMRDAALKAGVRPEGFKHLAEAFDGYYLSQLQKYAANTDQALAKLETDFKQKFGDRSNSVLQKFNESFSGTLGKEQMAVIENLDPSVKVVLAEYHDSFSKKYIREDNLHLDVPTSSQGMSEGEYGKKYAELFAAMREHRPGTTGHIKALQALESHRINNSAVFKK